LRRKREKKEVFPIGPPATFVEHERGRKKNQPGNEAGKKKKRKRKNAQTSKTDATQRGLWGMKLAVRHGLERKEMGAPRGKEGTKKVSRYAFREGVKRGTKKAWRRGLGGEK